MAVTLSVYANGDAGDGYYSIVDITGPASYTTGGETLTAAQVNQIMPRLGGGLAVTDISKVQLFETEPDATGRFCVLDRTNSKVLFWTAAGAQTANATNISTVVVRCRFLYGKTNLG